MTDIFLGLGSNLGDRGVNLSMARDELSKKVTIFVESSIYETSPVGLSDKTPAGFFYNQVLLVDTTLSAQELLLFCLAIEDRMGRVREAGKVTSRVIDIDILFYGSSVINSSSLVIPHEKMHERTFVLEPLCELAPWFVHPLFGKTVSRLLYELGGEK